MGKSATPVKSKPKGRATLSLFGSKPAKEESKPEPVKSKPKAARPSLSLFGGSKPKVEPKTVSPPEPKKPAFSLFGGGKSKSKPAPKKAAPPAKKAQVQDAIPQLSKWAQNSDGSITGLVSNSDNFRSGTKITTSPVRKGAKPGSVVKTGSGSQYRLN